MPGKVAKNLTADELKKLFEELRAESADPTLKMYVAAAARYNQKISQRSGATTLRRNFEDYCRELERKKNAVEFIGKVTAETGEKTADVALRVGLQELLDRLVSGDELTNEDVTCMVGALTCASRLPIQIKDAESKIKTRDAQIAKMQFDASKAVIKNLTEFKDIAMDGSLDSDEKVERVRARLFGDAAATPGREAA